ncbi:hypothetical protein HP397_06760, partial [Streptobacillus felis]
PQRATQVTRDLIIESFSTNDERFSSKLDLLRPYIETKKDMKPTLNFMILQLEKTFATRKVEFITNERKIIYEVPKESLKFVYFNNKLGDQFELIINDSDVEEFLEMTREEGEIKLIFTNDYEDELIKVLTEKEKEILNITILNYIYKLNNMNGKL